MSEWKVLTVAFYFCQRQTSSLKKAAADMGSPNCTTQIILKRYYTCFRRGYQQYIIYSNKVALEWLPIIIRVLTTCSLVQDTYASLFLLMDVSFTNQDLQTLRALEFKARNPKRDSTT